VRHFFFFGEAVSTTIKAMAGVKKILIKNMLQKPSLVLSPIIPKICFIQRAG